MYGILTFVFFIAALLSAGDVYKLMGFAAVSALFAIAAGISSIYEAMTTSAVSAKIAIVEDRTKK